MVSDVMNAIDLLKSQHRTLRNGFAELRRADTLARKARLFADLADLLSVHVAVAEHHLYPAIRARDSAAVLSPVLEALDEHRNLKRVLADLMGTSIGTECFGTLLHILRELVEHHVRIEEEKLFPAVGRCLGTIQLRQIGRAMSIEVESLESAGAPRLLMSSPPVGEASI